MRPIVYLLFAFTLTGCFTTSLLNQEMSIVKKYANYYSDQLEPNSTLTAARYTFTVEKISENKYIKKVFFPETKQLTKYITFFDDKLRMRHGLYKHYYDNGNQTVEGYYKNGIRSGKWKYFSTHTYTHYLISFGNYENDQKTGLWTGLDSLGNIYSEHTYLEDELNGSFTIYNEDGSIKNKGIYEDGEMVKSSIEIEENNNPDSIKIVERMPIFTSTACKTVENDYKLYKECGTKEMLMYIYRRIRYPIKAREEYVQGTALVRFMVDKTGVVRDTECINCICQPIKDEVLRLVNSFPDWTPGEQRGEPVNVYFNLPIKFRLE